MTRSLVFALLTMTLATPAFAQLVPPPTRTVSLSGPRVGLTFLDDRVVTTLKDRQTNIRPTITQFGWQFEKQFFARSGGGGLTALNEWVVLFGGLEQGVVLPSVSWLVGLRTSGGAEIGVGPNVTPLGVALAVAAGTTFRAGALNVPVNIAVVPSRAGMRVSVLPGFSLRGR